MRIAEGLHAPHYAKEGSWAAGRGSGREGAPASEQAVDLGRIEPGFREPLHGVLPEKGRGAAHRRGRAGEAGRRADFEGLALARVGDAPDEVLAGEGGSASRSSKELTGPADASAFSRSASHSAVVRSPGSSSATAWSSETFPVRAEMVS